MEYKRKYCLQWHYDMVMPDHATRDNLPSCWLILTVHSGTGQIPLQVQLPAPGQVQLQSPATARGHGQVKPLNTQHTIYTVLLNVTPNRSLLKYAIILANEMFTDYTGLDSTNEKPPLLSRKKAPVIGWTADALANQRPRPYVPMICPFSEF